MGTRKNLLLLCCAAAPTVYASGPEHTRAAMPTPSHILIAFPPWEMDTGGCQRAQKNENSELYIFGYGLGPCCVVEIGETIIKHKTGLSIFAPSSRFGLFLCKETCYKGARGLKRCSIHGRSLLDNRFCSINMWKFMKWR